MPGCFSVFKSSPTSGYRPPTLSRKASVASSKSTLVGDGSSLINEKTSGTLIPSIQAPLSILKPTPTADRLTALRALMSAADLDLYLVPSDDAHASEYTAPRDQLRGFISGFTGSAGFAIVAREGFAGLWTDSRYFVQAEQQLDAEQWTLFKLGLPDVPGWEQWLTSEAFEILDKKGLTFGVDARLISQGAVKSLLEKGNAGNYKLEGVFDEDSLVAKVWTDPHLPFHETYPPALDTPVHQHPLEFAGEEAQSKLGKIVQWLKGADVADLVGKESVEKGMAKKYGPKRGDHYVVNALDEVAWSLNLRGLSIPYNPVFPAYLIISIPYDEPDISEDAAYSAQLFVPPQLLSHNVDAGTYSYVTSTLNVAVLDYSDIWSALKSLPGKGKVILGDKASYALVSSVGSERAFLQPNGALPIALLKARKNAVELEGMRKAYLRDGVAWAKWAAWLEETVQRRGSSINEWDAAVRFQQIRSGMHNYAGFDAYESISASGGNAALPHYETPEEGSKVIDRVTPYLNDSGAQYFDGTIDCTRTVHFGKPTKEQKNAYTKVLQGHIAIDSAIFPEGTSGAALDTVARIHLWKDKLNYLHGTGHGIGSFGYVHEGPSNFWFGISAGATGASYIPLQPGYTLSNEPGYYKPNKHSGVEDGGFGLRIESILAVKALQPDVNGGKWLGFERLTRVPIATNLVDYSLLTPAEKKWLKEHNEQIKKEVGPLLRSDRRAKKWLDKQ